jgi:basic membrane lipoprotein Med (substrate-binding protein (PBP1-ABC) superfamily)/DNA-binding SARP family transcriptional activator
MRFEVLGSMRAVGTARGAVSTGAPVSNDAVVAVRSEGQAASHDGPTTSLGGPKQRLVLALLLAEPNTVVSLDRLVEGIWEDRPPTTARHTVQSYVSELRKEIGTQIERSGSGYVVNVDRDTLDSLDFESRVSLARAVMATEPAVAVAELESALALWSGAAFEEFLDCDALRVERARLDELRVAAAEDLIRSRLAIGQHAEVIPDLVRLTSEHPYREELRALHMVALYRAGRQAEALREYQRTRRVLDDDLGIAPSARLRRLEEQILLQDPDLEPVAVATVSSVASSIVENPYLGLRAFQEQDESRFFGRDALVSRILERVSDDARLTAVVGPSGSGKSSVVQAGVIPRVRRDFPSVRVARMQPGAQPFAELEAALSGVLDRRAPGARGRDGLRESVGHALPDGSTRLLLVIDQFEELFTMTEPDVAERFLDSLLDAIDDPAGRLRVILTLRADFYDRPLASPSFGARFADNVLNVVSLSPDELEAAATLPARRVDVELEPRLIGRLIADVAGQPNALPLFQFALTEVFDERTSQTLDLRTYERIGGVRKAVARRAEALFERLGDDERDVARQFFLRVATISDGIVGRRRVPASELVSLDVDVVALQSVIDAFARYRLLALDRDPATGEPTIEVAHEALLAEWARLRDWLEEGRSDLITHAAFATAMHEWKAARRSDGYLLSGARLGDYERWAGVTRLRLTGPERAFLDESIAQRDREVAEINRRRVAEARRRRRSRVQLAILGIAAALVAAVVVYPIVTRDDPEQMAVALSAPRADSVFDALIADGAAATATKHGLDLTIVEPPFAEATAALRAEAETGPRLIMGGFLIAESMLEIAPEFPDTTFVLYDWEGTPPGKNVVAVNFAEEEGSFLAGAAAALESTTGRVGYLGANTLPLIEGFRAGFEAGARAVDPNVQVVSRVIKPPVDGEPDGGGYQNAAIAKNIATGMYLDDGVDVIFVAAGGSGAGVAEAATELSAPGRKLWMIGVDNDEAFNLPLDQREHVLTSMLKRLDIAIEVATERSLDGSLPVPGTIRLGLAEGAVGYATGGDHLTANTIDRLRELTADIVEGRRSVDPVPLEPIELRTQTPATDGARAVFEDGSCSFDGRADYASGSRQQFILENRSSEPMMLTVWLLPPGTAADEIPSGSWLRNAQEERDFQALVDAGPGETAATTIMLDSVGEWAVFCEPRRGAFSFAGGFTVSDP